MSITASLSNALTGLAAASRSAQVVSSNVSNALTEGYARREVNLSPRFVGGAGAGVQVDGISRIVDENLLREKRLAAAAVGEADVRFKFDSAVFDLVGSPEQRGSLVSRVANFETALIAAASRPDAEARLTEVLSSARSVAEKFNTVSDGIQKLREDADAQIGREVDRLNTALEQVATINKQILRAKANEQDYPSLLDQRQTLIDNISQLVPIRQLPRENDTVALYTMGGALLLDIEPAEFGFQSRAPITADMTLASGALSGLTLNGNAIETAGTGSAIAGGELSGLFEIRDETSVAFQSNIDESARDLVARFQDPAVDPTLAVGDPGLFTDAGSALDLADLVGLSGRLEVNALVDPTRGGETSRLRDGLGAVAVGSVGDSTLLDASLAALSDSRPPLGGSFSGASKDFSEFVSALTSLSGQAVLASSTRSSFETAHFEGLEETFLSGGVDTDLELQNLLLIEQAYAANAKVIQTADELIQLLIGL